MNPLAMRLSAGMAGVMGMAALPLPANFVELVSSIGHHPEIWGPQAPHRFSAVLIAAMVKEWPVYVSMFCAMPVQNLDADPDHIMMRCTEFWRAARSTIPNLAQFARYAFAIVPSSASAERVFSLLKRYFSLLAMHSALTDYTAGSCMLQYNKNTTGVKNA